MAQGAIKTAIKTVALYLQNGHLNFVTRIKNENTIARDELPFLHEPVKVLAEFRRDMQLVLTVDDREAARVEAPGMLPPDRRKD